MSAISADQPVIEALDTQFQRRRSQVPVLRQRAEAEGISQIRSLDELVPLLFPHTVYKSYPASLVDQGRWAQMNRWLSSTSTSQIDLDVTGVADVDSWIECLAAAGHFVAASSGTTGKSSFLVKSAADLDAAASNHVAALAAAGVTPDNRWHLVSLGPGARNVVSSRMSAALAENFVRPDNIPRYPAPMATVGNHAYMDRMIRIRRALAEGTASPDDMTALEAETATRERETEDRLAYYADEVLARPGEPILLGTMMALAWRFVETLRARGVTPGRLDGNAVYMAGGTKGVELPPDHAEQIRAVLGVESSHFMQLYSMQEINLAMPRCVAERYHVPRELTLLVLDHQGEALAPVSDGQAEGRAAFFDFTVDGRWGGIMSGDRIRAEFGICPCGQPGPTVFSDIVRYTNVTDGDKITCAGTMDAYVRGFVDG